jgi:hypothetical protein
LILRRKQLKKFAGLGIVIKGEWPTHPKSKTDTKKCSKSDTTPWPSSLTERKPSVYKMLVAEKAPVAIILNHVLPEFCPSYRCKRRLSQ